MIVIENILLPTFGLEKKFYFKLLEILKNTIKRTINFLGFSFLILVTCLQFLSFLNLHDRLFYEIFFFIIY